jgi:uncharacterized protein
VNKCNLPPANLQPANLQLVPFFILHILGDFMLKVKNLTRKATLVKKGRVADNHWTRLKGLIGVRHLAEGDGLLIKPCRGVHCMFMSIPIDVLYVDQDDQVVGADANMKPWRVGWIYRKSKYVIELPAGTLARTGTTVGDRLQVHY